MLSQAENDLITRVGPGQPAGELLRRYWMPIAMVQELTDEQPTKFVRLLGEDLVLFRDKSGRVGLLADHCSHRGASLCYGRVEERGISCAYHGWLYDTAGNILETPPERNDAIMRTVKQKAYPVQQFLSMFWAYLGPEPAPVIPRYDVWARKDGHRKIVVHPRLDCNWFQAMENSVDPAHLQILHQEHIGRGQTQPVNTTRGYTDDVASFDFRLDWFGIIKHREYIDGKTDEHPLIFPNILRQGNATQLRVPVDDTHTNHIHIQFYPTPDGSEVEETDIPVEYLEPYKDLPDERHPVAKFKLESVIAQDHMAWETQGPIADRTVEHLSYSDRGVHMLRRLTMDQIERVRQGLDPMGVTRDPNHGVIDTNLYGEAQGVKSDPHPTGLYTAAEQPEPAGARG